MEVLMKKPILLILAILLALTLVATPFSPHDIQAAPEPPPQNDAVDPALVDAFNARIYENQTNVLAFLLNDIRVQSVRYSSDGKVALMFLAMFDSETGEIIVGEPGLAIAELDDSDPLNPIWQVTLQVDETFLEALEKVPFDIFTEEARERYYVDREESKNFIQSTVYRGYKLPWAAGTARRLSQSVQHIHTTCAGTLSCLYAFDFADRDAQANWPILASKGGIVTRVKWDTPDRAWNDYSTPPPGTGNYIVLEDRSTNPTTYQLYLHLSYNTIPPRLRTPGAIVSQGEFIGNVDNTGQSWGSHLHYHVHANATSYWGSSVDIRFDDVSINDGRPRTCWEASNMASYGNQCNTGNWFVSGNIGTNPPGGDLVLPGDGEVFNTSTLMVGGSAWDDQQVSRIQIIVRGVDGVWRDMGDSFTNSPFAREVNLCSLNMPNGPVDIALRVWDNHGNVTVTPQGLRTIMKNHTCSPPPACTPSPDKVVIYSQPNYQGVCKEFALTGNWEILAPNLGTSGTPVGSDNTASIRVGSNVRGLLFDEINYGGRSETFEADDPNLGDNMLGAKTAASLKVQRKDQASPHPIPDGRMLSPTNGATISSTTSITLTMSNQTAGFANTPTMIGATSFRFDLQQVNPDNSPAGDLMRYDNLPYPWLSIGTLPPGRYRLLGRAFNNSGRDNNTGWIYFDVTSAALPNTALKNLPYAFDFTSTADWHASGLWQHTGSTWRYGSGTSYAGSGVNSGGLTSPPIAIPASGTAYLRFDYKYRTESPQPLWDQRLIQISVDGGPFNDLPEWPQLWNDPPDPTIASWLTSPAIDLSAYRGKTIRIRFYLNTLDGLFNQGSGWEINRFEINTTAPELACANNPANNSINAAVFINIPQTLDTTTICPGGDVDYYQFYGIAGQRIVARVDAKSINSSLDPYLFLLDHRGSLLLENDDIQPGVDQDSQIGAVLPYSGLYYLKVKAWDHPRAGGSSYFYRLRLLEDGTPPWLNLTFPSGSWISDKPFNIQAEINDFGSGIQKVNFYYRPPDATYSLWYLLGTDEDGSDGWSLNVNPANLGGMVGGTIFVEAISPTGVNWGDMRINLQIDTIKPTSSLNSVSSSTNSTAVQLSWSASDGQSGVNHLEVQYRVNGGSWQSWSTRPPGTSNNAWFLGEAGKSYEFRLRAVDLAGNAQDWPATIRGPVSMNVSCPSESIEPANNNRTGANALAFQTYMNQRFCPQNDVDWVSFQAQAGKQYMLVGASDGGGAAATLRVEDSNGNLWIEKIPASLGQTNMFLWTAPANGTYYLRATPKENGLYGGDVRYRLWYGEPKFVYLPSIQR
jgi:hypothetical protein